LKDRPIHRIGDLPVHQIPIGTLQILSGEQSMIFWAKLKAGTHTPAHQHPGEQMTWLVSGRLKYRVGTADIREVAPGEVVLIRGQTEHEAWYVDDCEIVEFHAPPRFDLYPAARHHPYAIE
jgi:quercetin dioxygenase-like cupin family protein